MSHVLFCRDYFAGSLYASNYGVLHTIVISITKRFQKSVGSLFLTNKNAYSIINSRIKIRVSGERPLRPGQENKAKLSKIFKQF